MGVCEHSLGTHLQGTHGVVKWEARIFYNLTWAKSYVEGKRVPMYDSDATTHCTRSFGNPPVYPAHLHARTAVQFRWGLSRHLWCEASLCDRLVRA